jgi:DNA-binding GntR family transcriptional regulator
MKTLPNQELRQTVHERVREFVLSSVIAPGGKIDETILAAELGVSKTPVREALFKLSHDGIVKILPNRGSFKAKLTKEDMLDIMETRELLEGLAVRYAADNATSHDIRELRALHKPFEREGFNAELYPEVDKQFHFTLFRLSGRSHLIHILQNLDSFNAMLRQELFESSERVRVSVARHSRIIAALEARDGKTAEKLVRKSIRTSLDYLTKQLFPQEAVNSHGG